MNAGAPRVAHQPGDHPYVLHLAESDDGAGQGPGPSVWDISRLRDARIRVVHLHFGFEHLAPHELTRWAAALDAAGIALVYTVHDLDNPHLIDQRPFHHSVGILVRAAAAVVTLTPAAAALIEQRYRRRAHVVAHPHVVPLTRLGASSHEDAALRSGVYVHAATLRPNFDIELMETLAASASPHGGLRIHVRDSAPTRLLDRLVEMDDTSISVTVEPRLSDDALWDRLATARLLVLPYRWGTHSGLLEAARDLGTPTLAPGFGGYLDQGAHLLDRTRLDECMRRAIASPPRTSAAGRRRQRHRAAGIHQRLYRRAGRGGS